MGVVAVVYNSTASIEHIRLPIDVL